MPLPSAAASRAIHCTARSRHRALRSWALAAVAVALCVDSAVAPAQGSGIIIPAAVMRPTTALSGAALFVAPASPARRQAEKWRVARPADAALMERIASQPTATWLGEWSGRVGAAVRATIAAARANAATSVPVFVAYNIPHRDCGGYSAGGAARAKAYRAWIHELARALSGAPSVVVLEPDALAGIDCLAPGAREERLALIRGAVQVLKAAGAGVYLDAGHARWHPADTIAARLVDAGIAEADGFTLNVANFVATDVSIAYGDSISQLTGGKHYVVDTSRNGAGGTADNRWCNPAGQALGVAPTTSTGHELLDAFLWIKVPGESDGACNGGPRAGAWWPDYALGLVQRYFAGAPATSAPANDVATNNAAANSGPVNSAATNVGALTLMGWVLERVAALPVELSAHP